MPKTRDSPTETRKSRADSATALRSCSSRIATVSRLLREVLRTTLRCHLVARVRRENLGNEVRVLRVLDRLDDKTRLDGLMIALPHEELSLEPFVGRILPGLDHLLDVVRARLLDDLGEPLHALVGLAVEHVRVEPVHLVEALHEVPILRRVDGERIARPSDGAGHRVAYRPHVLELHDLHDRVHFAGEAELVCLLEEDGRVLPGERKITALRAGLLDLRDVAREILRADGRKVLADDLLSRSRDQFFEGA